MNSKDMNLLYKIFEEKNDNNDIKEVIDKVYKMTDIEKVIKIIENNLYNAIYFLTMNFPQEVLAKKYFTEAIATFDLVLRPAYEENKDNSDFNKYKDKIEKLEELIKDIKLDI